MKFESPLAKTALLLTVFVALSLIFAFFRDPIADVNNWLLLAFHEGRVTKGVAEQEIVVPKMKVEQLKSAPSPVAKKGAPNTATAITGTTTIDKNYKGAPKLTLNLPENSSSKDDTCIVNWALLGPLYYAKHPVRKDDYCFMESIDIVMVDNEAQLDGSQLVSYAKWSNLTSTMSNGKVDLRIPFPKSDFAVIYAVALIDSPEEIKDAALKAGSDDYEKVWVNGEVVLKYNEKCRGAFFDNDTSKRFTLKKGVNKIVFKCVQISMGWEFFARLVDSKDKSLTLRKDPVFVK